MNNIKVFLVVWILIILGILATVVFMTGCATLRGVSTDLGIVKSPATIPVKVPEPGRQLWNAVKKSNWLVTLSILGIAAGVFALVNGSVKLGTASIASASVSLFMALAVARFALWMAVFGLIGSVIAALFSILVRRKALVEIIRGVQKHKDSIIEDTGGLRVRLNEEQSKTTKRIVGNLKNELRLKGQI